MVSCAVKIIRKELVQYICRCSIPDYFVQAFLHRGDSQSHLPLEVTWLSVSGQFSNSLDAAASSLSVSSERDSHYLTFSCY